MSEGDASGTNGSKPSPYSLLIEGPPQEEEEPNSGEVEQNSSRSSFSSLASVFASAADRKSNHGFAELSEKISRKCHSNREHIGASEERKRVAPHDRDVNAMLVHERQLL